MMAVAGGGQPCCDICIVLNMGDPKIIHNLSSLKAKGKRVVLGHPATCKHPGERPCIANGKANMFQANNLLCC